MFGSVQKSGSFVFIVSGVSAYKEVAYSENARR